MDREDYCSSSRFFPEPGVWSCQYTERDHSPPAMDGPHRESHRHQHSAHKHASVPISQQSSGYSSTASGCSSSRNNRGLILPGGRRSLSRMRDSLVSVDEGSVINNYFFFNTAPTQCPEERNDRERLNHSSQIVRSISEPTVFGRRRRGAIPTCHISPRNERLLNEFAPLLVDDMDANALLPHLMRYGLANREDTDYISNPYRTSRERNMHIIRTAPHKDSNAFERFVRCLEEVQSDLAVQLRQRMRRSSSARLQLADEVTSNQQGHAYEEPNETESIMVPQPARDIGPDSQDLSPPTRLPEVFHEERSHDNPDSQDERSPATQDERSPATQEVQADLSRGDSYSHYTCKKLMQKKLMWLQENTAFQDCHEEIQFSSRTNCGEHRKVLHYGTLYKQGKARFVVLLTDFLLVLKLLEPHSHSRRAAEQQRFEDHMFSDNKYIGKPLLLHHLEVQDQNKQRDSFSLHYKQTSVDLCFEAPSKASRDAWLEALSDAIANSCRLQSRLKLHIGSEVAGRLGGRGQWLSLTILGASALLSVRECSGYCRRLFCTVVLGQHQQCRTPSVEGKTDASWNFTFEFWKFATTDTLEIGVWQENNFCPNDLLGVVRISLLVMTDKHTNTVHPGHEMEASLPLKPSGSGEMHLKIYTDINP